MKRLIHSVIEKNQNIIISNILNCKEQIVFIKSKPLTGKTTILKKAYDMLTNSDRIFISGCDPKNMYLINPSIIAEIKTIVEGTKNDIAIFCDEYCNKELLEMLETTLKNNIRVLISTNIEKKYMNGYKVFNIYQNTFVDVAEMVYKKANIDLSDRINNENINLVELSLISKNYKDLKAKKVEIKNELKRSEKQRQDPTSTFLLYVNEKYSMLKNFDFDI